jgi:hypothetical protein
MKHARKDYDKVMKKIPEDEPVFVLRGQDAVAANTVRFWAAAAATAGAAPDIVEAARKHADLMEAWPTKKIPDMPKRSAEKAEPDTHDGKGPVS